MPASLTNVTLGSGVIVSAAGEIFERRMVLVMALENPCRAAPIASRELKKTAIILPKCVIDL